MRILKPGTVLSTLAIALVMAAGITALPAGYSGYTSQAYAAAPAKGKAGKSKPGVGGGKPIVKPHQCGNGDAAYTPVIDLGCRGQGNPIMDALFGIIHFLSLGVGLVVVGSIIVGGIQYSASRGDPQATATAINRIRSALVALLIFIFGYALLNYILPGFVL